MNSDERHWIEEAIGVIRKASSDNVMVMLVRCQDANDEADIVMTNATDPAVIRELGKVWVDSGGEE